MEWLGLILIALFCIVPYWLSSRPGYSPNGNKPITQPKPVSVYIYPTPASYVGKSDVKVPVVRNRGVVPEWFIDPWVVNLTISPAEQKIIDELQKYDIKWAREISFKDIPMTDKGSYYRYDFLLIDYSIVIEYHGKLYHSDPERVTADRLKERFCIAHDIEYITYTGKDYYNMDYEISELMSRLNVTHL